MSLYRPQFSRFM